MASYYRVSPKFWLKARQRGWTDAQTTLALYLLTCEHRNLEGLYRLPKPYVASDLDWTAKKVDECLAVVCESGFAVYDEEASMVLIPSALKFQAPSTEKQIKGAVAQLRQLPRTCLWNAFRIACESHCKGLADEIEKAWPSHSDRISHASAGPRGGSSSSSSSSSISISPLAPPADAGGGPSPGVIASLPRNSRALGTNPRAVNNQLAATVASDRALVAVGGLTEPTEKDRTDWERLQPRLVAAVGDQFVIASHIEALALVGVDGDGRLVLDGPDEAWAWSRQRFLSALLAHAEAVGVGARFATADEHAGLHETGAAA